MVFGWAADHRLGSEPDEASSLLSAAPAGRAGRIPKTNAKTRQHHDRTTTIDLGSARLLPTTKSTLEIGITSVRSLSRFVVRLDSPPLSSARSVELRPVGEKLGPRNSLCTRLLLGPAHQRQRPPATVATFTRREGTGDERQIRALHVD